MHCARGRTPRPLALAATLTGWFEWDLSTGRMLWRPVPGPQGRQESVPSSVDEALALVDPDYHADLMTCLRDVRNGTTREIEFRLMRQDPSDPEWLWLHMTPICNEVGVVARVVGLARDVTVRRRALNAVLEAAERERDVAAILQHALLPVRVPAVDGVAISAHYRPAGSDAVVGGDFYDIVETDDGFSVYVGDVCGRGVVAAVTTSLARHTLRAALRAGQPLRRQLQWLHRAVLEEESDNFVTCGAMHCDRVSGGEWDASVILAGHPPAMLVRQGRAMFIGEPGTLLGVVEPQLHEVRLRLLPGDRVVWYTDGLSDAARPRLTEGDLLAVAESGADLATDEFAALLMARSAPPAGASCDDTALVVIDVVAATT